MELEPLFMTHRWEIIRILSERAESPLEISQKLNTTISYISQQLKLLEAAGLVKKQRVPARDKGKPRTIFSLSKDCLYMISIADKFAEKKLIPVTDYHKLILKIWFIDDSSLHYFIEKFYWKIEENLSEIDSICVNKETKGLSIILVSKNPEKLRLKLGNSIKKFEHEVKDFSCQICSEKDFWKRFSPEKIYALYDPNRIVKIQKELKGGNQKDV